MKIEWHRQSILVHGLVVSSTCGICCGVDHHLQLLWNSLKITYREKRECEDLESVARSLFYLSRKMVVKVGSDS